MIIETQLSVRSQHLSYGLWTVFEEIAGYMGLDASLGPVG